MRAYRPEDTPAKAVTLSPEDVRQARRLLQLLTGAAHGPAERASGETHSAEQLLAVAKFFVLLRQERAKHFSPAMFGEPAWDLLLSLYVGEDEPGASTVSCLAKSAAIPVTTAVRWMDYLEEKRLIERSRNQEDRRTSTVSLSEHGRKTLQAYFGEILAQMAAFRP